MPDADHNLTPADLVALSVMLDRVVPPVDDLPGAGGLGLAPRVDELSRRIPGLRRPLLRVMGAAALDPAARVAGGWPALDDDEQVESLQAIETNMPAHFSSFVELAFVAYYSDDRVLARIGYDARAPQPEGYALPPWDDALLDTVRQREPFWRAAPE